MRELADIVSLITNQKEEDLHLEYKGCDSLAKTDSKKAEITKDVSAFANSDGGIIIYGVNEFSETDKRHLPEKIDIGYDPSVISKEWLEQIINSGIQPRIKGVIIHPIKNTKDKLIYVVEVPRGETAHQAKDLKYYRRYNFEVLAMHDYEIRDVMGRDIHPELIPEIKSRLLPDYTGELHEYEIQVFLKNVGKKTIRNFKFEISLPIEMIKEMRGETIVETFDEEGFYLRKDNTIIIGYRKYAFYNPDTNHVIFPNDELLLIPHGMTPVRAITIKIDRKIAHSIYRCAKLYWRLYADEMPFKEGEIEIRDGKLTWY